MTGATMLTGVQELLHDSGRGFATDDRMFDPDDILVKLNEAKSRVGKMFCVQPQAAFIAASRLSNQATGADGYTPANFLEVIGGLRTDNSFIPPTTLGLAPLVSVGNHDFVYAQSGVLHGPFAKVAWWAEAVEEIEKSNVPLTEFSDSVYYMIQILAAREMLPQEKADALDRWKLMTKMVTEEMASFA